MSKEYPCIYNEKGICKFYTTEDITSYCIDGPCHRQKLSNADRIRAMSDEELADLIIEAEACGNEGVSIAAWGMTMLEWLKQPAEE